MEGNETTKIYCGDGGSNNPMAMAAMMNGGMNGQWNNPFIYLVWLMFAQRFGYGNNGCGDGCCNNPQLAQMQNQMQDNQNSNMIMDAIKGNNAAIGDLATRMNCDSNELAQSICAVRNAIDKVGGDINFSAERVINAANMGDCRIIDALNECCCNTQKELIRMQGDLALSNCQQTNALQRGQENIRVGMDKGFGEMAYAFRDQTCQLNNSIQQSTQAILGKLNDNKIEELQRENANLRSEKQMYSMFERFAIPRYGYCGGGYCGGGYCGGGCWSSGGTANPGDPNHP